MDANGHQYINIWVPIVNSLDNDLGKYNTERGLGKEIWWYDSNNSGLPDRTGIDDPSHYGKWPDEFIDHQGVNQLIHGPLTWKYRLQGYLYYGTTENYQGNVWQQNFYLGRNGDGTLFYPGRPGDIGGTTHIPVPSIRLQLLRQSWTMYDELVMLQERGRGDEADEIANSLVTATDDWSHDPSAHEAAREQLASKLEAGAPSSNTYDILVRKALPDQQDLAAREEHCSADPEKLATVGRALGHQVRIKRNDSEYALYTVSQIRQEGPDNIVRMGDGGLSRLHTTQEFAGTLHSQVTIPNEFSEQLADNGINKGLIAIAPHGGNIEPCTEDQALRVASRLAAKGASSWLCKGYKQGGGAYEAWHITSTDIHEASFPELNSVISRGFTYAVAFHGLAGPDIVLIGGTSPDALKQEIKVAIESAISGSGITVRVAQPGDNYNGDSPRNVVNRLTAGGANGVQIEQSPRARSDYCLAIAEAVANVYDLKLGGPDTSAPVTSASLSAAANAAGWHNIAVTVTLVATDEPGGSGVKEITYSASGAQPIPATTVPGSSVPINVTAEGQTTIFYFAKDVAGNVEGQKTLTIKLDKTKPEIRCGAADALWHKEDVSVACSALDGTSGLANPADSSFFLSTSVPSGTETDNAATGTRTICDLAGNCAAAGPIGGHKVDKKAPDITITRPADGDKYRLKASITADYMCKDGGSGVGSCVGPVPSGSNVDTASVGQKTFTVAAKDKVGNAASESNAYSVLYAFDGFYPPIKEAWPNLNKRNAGSTVPVKFSLSGDQGLDIFAPDYPKSEQIACGSTDEVEGKEPTNSTSGSGVSYDSGSDQYHYNWKTEKAWKGTCRQLVVKLKDGSYHRANFDFK